MWRPLAFALLFACKSGDHAAVDTEACGPAPILFVTATEGEMAPLVVHASATRKLEWATCGELAGRSVMFDVVGVGPRKSSHYIDSALTRFQVSAVIMVGIAGGISRDLRIGDVAIPTRWSRYDAPEAWFDADAALVRRATERAPALRACDDPSVCAAAPRLVVGGNGATGVRFVSDPAVGADIEKRLGAVVTDMETAAVAEVAQRHAVPFIAFRAVSDLVWTGRSDELIEKFDRSAEANAAAAAIELVRP